MSKKHKVIFQPSGRRGEIEDGKTILEAAQAMGVDIEGLCGNKKVCGKCKVRIEEGTSRGQYRIGDGPPLAIDRRGEEAHQARGRPRMRLSCTAEVTATSRSSCPNGRAQASRWCARQPRSSPSGWTRR